MKIKSTKRSIMKGIENAGRASVSQASKNHEITLDDRIKIAYQRLYNDIFQPKTIKRIK